LRSWSQLELDEAIRDYRARHAKQYRELLEAVGKNRRGAKRAAQKLFGRNAIGRELRCRSSAMVSLSPEWEKIRADFGFSKGRTVKGARIGLSVALDALTKSRSPVDLAEEKEMREMVALLAADQKDAILRDVQTGKMSRERAIEVIRTLVTPDPRDRS
jgi:hypothetical protein